MIDHENAQTELPQFVRRRLDEFEKELMVDPPKNMLALTVALRKFTYRLERLGGLDASLESEGQEVLSI